MVGVERTGVVVEHEIVGLGKGHVYNDEVIGRVGEVIAKPWVERMRWWADVRENAASADDVAGGNSAKVQR